VVIFVTNVEDQLTAKASEAPLLTVSWSALLGLMV